MEAARRFSRRVPLPGQAPGPRGLVGERELVAELAQRIPQGEGGEWAERPNRCLRVAVRSRETCHRAAGRWQKAPNCRLCSDALRHERPWAAF